MPPEIILPLVAGLSMIYGPEQAMNRELAQAYANKWALFVAGKQIRNR